MSSGDSVADWDDFFADEFVPSVIALVLDAWNRVAVPSSSGKERTVSLRLYAALLTGKSRERHPFLIRYEDVEVDTQTAEEIGRKDIVFFPSLDDEDIYFCLEAKRLNADIGGKRRMLGDEYVKSGMKRFVDGQYSRHVRHAGMLGYVLDGRTSLAMSNVLENIQAHCAALGMSPPGAWTPCGFRPKDPCIRVTQHRRRTGRTPLHIHHIFVAPGRAGTRAAAR